MTTELELAKTCIASLASEGVEAHLTYDDAGNARLRVPAWEAVDGDLCWRTVFAYIHRKLGGDPRNGLVLKTPNSSVVEVFTYDPRTTEDGLPVCADDLLHWGYGKSVDEFDWEEVRQPDENVWEDGYDAHADLAHVSQRVGFLSTLLNNEIVELPAVEPLTRQDLLDAIHNWPSGIFCNSRKPSELLTMLVSAEGQLVVRKKSDGSLTPITDDDFDKHGRVVFEGEVILHRTQW